MARVSNSTVFSNPNIVTVAAYLLGGKSKFIDIEDIALKAHELAPERFSWRKHPNLVDLGTIRDACSDAKKAKNGNLMAGSPGKGYMVTSEGVAFAKKKIKLLDGAKSKKVRISKKERDLASREKTRLMTTVAFEKFVNGDIKNIKKDEAEAFFRLDDYIVGNLRLQKINRIKNIFSDDSDLGVLVSHLALILKGR